MKIREKDIRLYEAVKLYEADRMEKGKKIESQGIKERETFLSKYPIESIPNLTIEQYLSGTNSFSYWLHYKLSNISRIKSARTSDFEVYSKDSQICLSRSYKTQFGSDYENAFIYLKKEIVDFLEDVKKEKYKDLEKYKINSIVKNMLMIVYFYDREMKNPIC